MLKAKASTVYKLPYIHAYACSVSIAGVYKVMLHDRDRCFSVYTDQNADSTIYYFDIERCTCQTDADLAYYHSKQDNGVDRLAAKVLCKVDHWPDGD